MTTRHFAAATGLLISISVLSLPSASASQSGASPASRPATPCQSNINPADDTGQAVPAQKYPATSAALSTSGAVLVRVSTTCALNYVTAYGKLVGTGTVSKVNIGVRSDSVGGPLGHQPGAPLVAYSNNPATGTVSGPYYVVNTTLPTTFTLAAGTFYWVQMQVKLNPKKARWFWEVVTPDPAGNSDEWRNPGNGWGCGTAWNYVSLPCIGGAPGKGLMTEVGT